MKNWLLYVAIAIVTLVGTAEIASAKKAKQGEEGLADQTAEGQKGTGFIHISVTNMIEVPHPQGGYVLLGDISATLRLRVKSDLGVFQTKIPGATLGIGLPPDPIEIDDFYLRNAILYDGFSSVDGRAGGIIADVFFPGDGFAATLKIIEENVNCEGAEANPNETTVAVCPPAPDPGSAAEVVKVADVTLAFNPPPLP